MSSLFDRARFGKECLIELLKCKYTPNVKFYRWHTMTSTRRCDDGTVEQYYVAVGPRVVQDIVKGLQNEEISIENYVFDDGQFWAESTIYRPPWFKDQNHRRERHKINCELRKNARSKSVRKKHRYECKHGPYKCMTMEEFLLRLKDKR